MVHPDSLVPTAILATLVDLEYLDHKENLEKRENLEAMAKTVSQVKKEKTETKEVATIVLHPELLLDIEIKNQFFTKRIFLC